MLQSLHVDSSYEQSISASRMLGLIVNSNFSQRYMYKIVGEPREYWSGGHRGWKPSFDSGSHMDHHFKIWDSRHSVGRWIDGNEICQRGFVAVVPEEDCRVCHSFTVWGDGFILTNSSVVEVINFNLERKKKTKTTNHFSPRVCATFVGIQEFVWQTSTLVGKTAWPSMHSYTNTGKRKLYT